VHSRSHNKLNPASSGLQVMRSGNIVLMRRSARGNSRAPDMGRAKTLSAILHQEIVVHFK
jgi:hypothetical protein